MAEPPESLHTRFQEAFNRHDLEAVVALYERGAVFVRNGELLRGIEAIRDAYRGYFASEPVIELETVAVYRAGELAMLHGSWSLRAKDAGGAPVTRQGRNTETARLQPDGRWLFVIDNPSAP